jgi:hypothetical protein
MDEVRLRITSDGTPKGTRVVTEDGTLIRGVQLVSWHLSTGEMARCTIEVRAVAVDLVGEGSMPEDPTAVVTLNQPQEAPEGPGFRARYHCPECLRSAGRYDDPDEVCAGPMMETTRRARWSRPMPERRGGRRKLNITGCKHVYKGTNSKGGEFNIYEVTAVAEAGRRSATS